MIGRLFILFSMAIGFGSVSAQIKVTGSLARDTIVIGDQVDFILSIDVDRDLIIESVNGSFLDSIFSEVRDQQVTGTDLSTPSRMVADVDILSTGNWKDTNENGIFERAELDWTSSDAGSSRLLENRFTFRFWDPGRNYIALPSVIGLSGQDTLFSEPVAEAVVYVELPEQAKSANSDSLQLAPIKPILDEPLAISDYMLYLIGGLILLSLILIYLVLRKIRKSRDHHTVIHEVPVPAHEIAITKLHLLREKRLWQKGKVVEFQTELTYIIREYLESRYEILALESTTYETIRMMSSFDLAPEVSRSLQRILQVADLVKFAKATPDSRIHEEFIDEALSFVRSTIITKNESEEDE